MPCVDAQLLISKPMLASLLQLPAGWQISDIRARPDGLLEVDAVLPEGPTDLPPVRLVPYYRQVHHDGGRAIALDRLEVNAQPPQRPARLWLGGPA